MSDIGRYAPRSGRLIRDDGSAVNEANGLNDDGSQRVQIVGADGEPVEQPSIHPGSRSGVQTILPSAAPIQIGESPLEGRHTIVIANPSPADHIYIGFDDGVTISSGFPVYAGQERLFHVADGVELFAVAETMVDVRIVEVR